jgi:hypothetical protein
MNTDRRDQQRLTQTPMPATALDRRGGGFIAFYSGRDGNAGI